MCKQIGRNFFRTIFYRLLTRVICADSFDTLGLNVIVFLFNFFSALATKFKRGRFLKRQQCQDAAEEGESGITRWDY